MKHLLKCICLSFIFLLPLITYAELTGPFRNRIHPIIITLSLMTVENR